jgi:hypothetical protein
MLSFSFQILSFYPGACWCPRTGGKEILLLTRGRAVQTDHCTARLCHLLQKSTAGVGKSLVIVYKMPPKKNEKM